MSAAARYQQLLRDIAEAFDTVFDAVCTAIIIKGHADPVHSVCARASARELLDHPEVAAALSDGAPRTLPPPDTGTLRDAALIGIEPLSTPPGDAPAVLVFALRDPARTDHAVALAHALATETARELTLLQHAPFLAEALETVECGVTIADPTVADTPLIYVNEAFTRLTGYDRSEVLGRNCRFMQGGVPDAASTQAIRHAIERGIDFTTVITNVRRNGETFQNRLQLRPIRGADGQVSHVVGLQTDVTQEQTALASLDIEKRRHESLIRGLSSYTWIMDPGGAITHVDEAWLTMAGIRSSVGSPPLETIRQALGPDTAQRFRDAWQEALATTQPFEVIYPLPPDEADARWFQDRITPVFNNTGRLIEWFGVTQEITALRKAERNFYHVIQNAPTGMLMIREDGVIEYANQQAANLFDYRIDELQGQHVDWLVPVSVRHRHPQLRARFLASPTMRRMGINREVRAVRRDGREFSAEVGLSTFGDPSERRIIAAITDKSELESAYEAMERTARTDRVTGLLSRDGFVWKLDELRAAGVLHPASMIISVDITGLREINNTQGYEVGDSVLREAGQRLRETLGHDNRIARPGGGEFLAIVAVDRRDTPARWRRRLERVFEPPFHVNGFRLFISVAFGYARIGGHAHPDSETLMNNAELALRQSQRRPSVNWTQYTRALEAHTRSVVTTTRSLRLALERDEFALHYQPKIDLHSGQPVSAEALLRWQHPERGPVPPGEFIPLAEQSQLIGPIGDWVLRQACADLRRWQDAGLAAAPVSVNLSLMQFQLGSVPDRVAEALKAFNVRPEQLTLEITESVFEENCEALRADLQALSALGVKLSLDDFGVGYSSLAHLNDYPFDEIKIDKSFTSQLGISRYGEAIVTAVSAIATAINAQIVAEGIESLDHVTGLKALGCRIGQGFYFSHPLPAVAWQDWLHRC